MQAYGMPALHLDALYLDKGCYSNSTHVYYSAPGVLSLTDILIGS